MNYFATKHLSLFLHETNIKYKLVAYTNELVQHLECLLRVKQQDFNQTQVIRVKLALQSF